MADLNSLIDAVESEESPSQFDERLIEAVQTDKPLTGDQDLASFVGQTDLGEPGLKDPLARFDVGAARLKSEKIAAFKKSFPEGELFIVPVSGEMLFQEDPSQPFKKVDADFLEGGPGEPILDVIEFFSQDIGAMLGETGAMLLRQPTPQGKAVGVVSTLLSKIPALAKFAGGAAGGQIAQEEVERARGLTEESRGSTLERAGGQAVATLVGGVVFDKLGRPLVNTIRGAGLVGLRTGAARAQQAAARLDVGELPVNLITDNPILQKIGGQSGALVPTLGRFVEAQEIATARAFAGVVQKKAGAQTLPATQILERAERQESRRILSSAKTNLGRGTKTLTEGGAAIRRGIAEYDVASNGRVNLAYANARAIETPEFNISSLQDTAAEVKALADELGPEGAGLAKLADDILALDPGLPPQTIDLPSGKQASIESTDQLRFLRSRAFDIKTPAVGEISRAPQKLAARLFGRLSGTLKNPVNANPKFLTAFKRADRLAAQRFSTRERLVLIQAAKSETPTQLAQRIGDLSRTASADDVKLLRSVLPQREFGQFQESVIADLLRNPDQLTARLKNAQPEALRQILNTKDTAVLKKVGTDIDRLQQTGIKGAVERQSRVGSLIAELAERGETAPIVDLVGLIARQGGKDGPLGRTIRAGLVDHIFKASTVFEKGATRVDFNRLRTTVARLNENGALRLLKSEDVRILNDVRRVQDFLRLSPDAGTSIQAAEAAAGVRVLGPAAIQTILENVGVGRLFTSKFGKRLLVGGGKEKLGPSETVQAVGGLLGIAATDAEATFDTTAEIVEGIARLPGRAVDFVTGNEDASTQSQLQR